MTAAEMINELMTNWNDVHAKLIVAGFEDAAADIATGKILLDSLIKGQNRMATRDELPGITIGVLKELGYNDA